MPSDRPLRLAVALLTLAVLQAAPAPPAVASEAEVEDLRAKRDEPKGPGRFRPARDAVQDPSVSDEQRREIERLQALGYLSGVNEAPADSGTVRHDRTRAHPGLNLYASGHAPEAILMDMDGEILHRWRLAFESVWPDHPVPWNRHDSFWRRVYLFPDGSLLAIYEGLGMVKIDRSSKLLWASDSPAHHDLEVDDAGRIHVLTRVAHMIPEINETEPILEDYVSVLSPDGEELSRVSVLEALDASEHRDVWYRTKRRAGDLFHTNTIELLDDRLEGKVPGFAAGRYLVSLHRLDAIGVMDTSAPTFTWMLQAGFDSQHDPRVLDDGHILLFDNRSLGGASRVMEIEPASGEVVWEYRGTEDEPFYSSTCGTAERLANGNTLITESDNGRAFEVTRDGEIVWEYLSPFRAGDDGELIATIMEMMRLPVDFPLDWREGATIPPPVEPPPASATPPPPPHPKR